MMKNFLYIAFILLFSCSEERQTEVISFEDLAGETGVPEQADTVSTLDSTFIPSEINLFIAGQLPNYDTLSHLKPHSIDRFGYSTQRKIEFTGKNEVPYGKTSMVIPKANLYYYTFSDSTKTKNAFYNWLDCYGNDCNVVKINEDIDAIKTTPMFTLVYDTCIVAVEYLCEHQKNDWKSFQDSLIVNFGRTYKYRIDVGCGGPLKWKQSAKN